MYTLMDNDRDTIVMAYASIMKGGREELTMMEYGERRVNSDMVENPESELNTYDMISSVTNHTKKK